MPLFIDCKHDVFFPGKFALNRIKVALVCVATNKVDLNVVVITPYGNRSRRGNSLGIMFSQARNINTLGSLLHICKG